MSWDPQKKIRASGRRPKLSVAPNDTEAMAAESAAESAVVPLIQVDDATGEFRACPETMAWLAERKEPFGVVSIAGKFRTGKSFLANRLADCKADRGFGVGDTVNACTRGLWICKQFYPTQGGPDVLFVDSEGIDALDATDDNDVRVFTLALMLSSVFLYNSVGHIDEAAISTLGLMTRVTSSVKQSLADDAAVSDMMPTFFWMLRDFSLRLEDARGNPISKDQYLEQSLQPAGTEERTATRDAIRECFPARHLATLPRPAKDEANATDLNARPWLISARFHEELDTFRATLIGACAPVASNGVPLTGRMYASLCAHLCEHGRAQMPMVRDTWTLLAAIQARDLKDALLAEFAQTLQTWKPADFAVLRAVAVNAVNDLLASFEAKSMKPVSKEVRAALRSEAAQLAERRVLEVGMDTEQIVGASVASLDRALGENGERAGDGAGAGDEVSAAAVASTLEEERAAFFAEHEDADTRAAWLRRAFPALASRWLPALLERSERAARRRTSTLQAERDARAAEAAACAAELGGEREERARAVDELRSEAVALKTSLVEERELAEGLRVALREAAAAPATELAAEEASLGEQEWNKLGARLRAAEAELLDEKKARIDECAALQETVDRQRMDADAVARTLKETNEALHACRQRETMLNESLRAGLDKLKREAEAVKKQQNERIARLEEERAALEAKLRQALAANDDLGAANARLVEEREREVRQARETSEKSRSAAEQANERVVSIHRSMLDDIRMRDERTRELQTRYMTDQLESQGKASDALRTLESSRGDNTSLKKRVLDLEENEAECKRMRVEVHELAQSKTRGDAEKMAAAARAEVLQTERDQLRQQVLAMEGELSVLRAEKELREAAQGL